MKKQTTFADEVPFDEALTLKKQTTSSQNMPPLLRRQTTSVSDNKENIAKILQLGPECTGAQIIKLVMSDEFGKHGESQKLLA